VVSCLVRAILSGKSADALAPIAVGFALAVGVFIAEPVTGGSVNPARSLGPIIGSVLDALLYDRFVAQAEAPA
jgi:glycerol uptake facilitator-like aquaporin